MPKNPGRRVDTYSSGNLVETDYICCIRKRSGTGNKVQQKTSAKKALIYVYIDVKGYKLESDGSHLRNQVSEDLDIGWNILDVPQISIGSPSPAFLNHILGNASSGCGNCGADSERMAAVK